MVPTWLPKWSQDGQKIDPKIDHFLMLLKSIFGWIMLDYGPKLSHIGNKMVSKIDVNFESLFFKKSWFFLRKNSVFWDPMGRSWKHTPTKKHSTNGVQDGMHLGIDRLTILLDVWCRVGKQSQPRIDFGTKIQHNPSKDRFQEASRKWSSLGSIFSAHVIPELVCLIPELIWPRDDSGRRVRE